MFGTQDGQLGASNIGGSKKGDALNMIPVRMAQEQVRVYRAWLHQQRLTQSPKARASVKDDERVVIEPYFDTGCIATVAHCGGSWCGYRPPCPPEPDLHAPFPSSMPLQCLSSGGNQKPLATGHWRRVHNPPCTAAVSGDDRVAHSAQPRVARHRSGRVGRQRVPTCRVPSKMPTHD